LAQARCRELGSSACVLHTALLPSCVLAMSEGTAAGTAAGTAVPLDEAERCNAALAASLRAEAAPREREGVDLEAQSVSTLRTEGTSTPASSDTFQTRHTFKGDSRRRRCCRKRVGACSLVVLVAVAALAFFLWPRDPQWEVKKITVSQETVNGLIAAFTSTQSNGNASFPMEAVVDIENPNFLGAHAGAGSFVAKFGPYEVAQATSQPLSVRGRSPGTVSVDVVSRISPEASAVLLKAVQPDFKLTVEVTGHLPARSLGLNVKVSLECSVLVDVLQLVSDPDNMIIGHNCSYHISL